MSTTKSKSDKLTRRERLFLKQLVENPAISIAQAARNAGYAEATVRSDIYSKIQAKPSIRESLTDIMEKQGLTDEQLIDSLAEGLQSTKVISANIIASDGEGMKDANSMTKDFINVPDFIARYKYLDMAWKLKDKYPSSKHQITGKDDTPLIPDKPIEDMTLDELNIKIKKLEKEIDKDQKKDK